MKGQCLVCHSCNKFSNVTECDLQPPENCTAEKPLCKITQEKTGIPGMEMCPVMHKDAMKPVWDLYRRLRSGNFGKIFGIQN
ncbi:unnamed protein product [Ranitomeya imitator]|uniref:Uncharacterized protein n=1 Tax=Ranitomeya imitator TaxID=111125 RepID=A0ABN9LYS4_9NEOB|nr:unnamed protein product [Ranitomeya imitator]